ncbi:radical SAM/SPASM domain-containing protein [Pseudomonas aeruginosa]|uniref:radical SAM/SPASM domain-containing protein n=1 Tax=Pseudomonas aeruginosa TaxID=287 RepID=UPI00053F00D7|nr:radical SAM protein [Pseudomonas aeruginosa]
MKYGFNTRYSIEKQDIKGYGSVFFVRKEHRDNIVILDDRSLALIKRANETGAIDESDEDTSTFARLAGEQVIIPLDPSDHSKSLPYTDSLSFWLQVTDSCNLACSYCYIPSLNSKQLFRFDLFDMLARKLLSINGLRTVNVKLAGGEPLMAFNKWKSGVIQLKELLADKGIELQLRLITNLTTLTNAMIEFIGEHDIAVSVSLDGLSAYHDRNRIYTGTQKGTFEIVDKNIKRLQGAGITPSVMVTVTSENHKGIPDLVDYLVQNDITFRLADAKGGYIDPAEFLSTMDLVSDVLRTGVDAGFPVSRRVVVSDLRTHYPSSTPCSMGKNAAAIYLDGSVYFCHTEFGKGKPLGHLDDNDSILEIIQKGRGKHFGLSDECQQCEYRLICAGGCPLYRVEGKSPMCQSYKKIIRQVFDLYEREQDRL